MLIVFDLDGTLLDTIHDIAYSMNLALEKYGYKTWETNEYINFIGSGVNEIVKKAMQKNNEEDFNKIKADYLINYQKYQMYKTIPFEGMTGTLNELKKQGHKLAVISNKPDDDVKRMMEHYYPGIFEFVLGFKNEETKKPNPITLEFARDYFKVKKEDMIYVGDSIFDYQYANNYGIPLIICLYGYEQKARLNEFKNTIFIEEPNDLIEVIKEVENHAK